MSTLGFAKVISWLQAERSSYQIKKFDYEKEAADLSVDYWVQQFDSYIQRLPIFGLDTPQGIQAALKLAATAVALAEHLADKNELPLPGYSSGEIHLGSSRTNPS